MRGVLVARSGERPRTVFGTVGGTRTRSITRGRIEGRRERGRGERRKGNGDGRTVNRFVDARTVEEGNVSPGVLGKVPKRFLERSRLV